MLLFFLPLALFLTPPLLVEIALGDAQLVSHLPAVALLFAEVLGLLVVSLLRERRLLAHFRADPLSPSLSRQATAEGAGRISVHLVPGLERTVTWGKAWKGDGVILLSRAFLAESDERDIARALRWGAHSIRSSGSVLRSALSALADALERFAPLRLPRRGRAPASVRRIFWVVGMFPLHRALRIWAGPSSNRL
jgi:hypothetical protein